MAMDGLIDLVPTSLDVTVGRSAAPGMVQEYGGPLPNARVQAYVNEVGRRVAGGASLQLPFTFTVLNSSILNAFALPGGSVFITNGLLHKIKNEAELAFILGHEVGHAVERHGMQSVGLNVGLNLLLAAATVSGELDSALKQTLAAGATKVASATYSRSNESESDEVGIDLMARAGYRPIAAAAALEPFLGKGKGSTIDRWMSSHPVTEDRVNTLIAMAGKYPDQGEVGAERYQEALQEAPLRSPARPLAWFLLALGGLGAVIVWRRRAS